VKVKPRVIEMKATTQGDPELKRKQARLDYRKAIWEMELVISHDMNDSFMGDERVRCNSTSSWKVVANSCTSLAYSFG